MAPGMVRLRARVHNLNATLQRLLHGASVRYREKALFLLVRKRTNQLEPTLETADAHLLRLAMLAVGLVHACRAELHDYALERPLLAIGVHAERHRRAGAERAEE